MFEQIVNFYSKAEYIQDNPVTWRQMTKCFEADLDRQPAMASQLRTQLTSMQACGLIHMEKGAYKAKANKTCKPSKTQAFKISATALLHALWVDVLQPLTLAAANQISMATNYGSLVLGVADETLSDTAGLPAKQPAFLYLPTRTVYLSRTNEGALASIHDRNTLPAPVQASPSEIITGFVIEGRFFDRKQTKRMLAAKL